MVSTFEAAEDIAQADADAGHSGPHFPRVEKRQLEAYLRVASESVETLKQFLIRGDKEMAEWERHNKFMEEKQQQMIRLREEDSKRRNVCEEMKALAAFVAVREHLSENEKKEWKEKLSVFGRPLSDTQPPPPSQPQ
jgi:hypothetical protein